jgi:hypothetical protein
MMWMCAASRHPEGAMSPCEESNWWSYLPISVVNWKPCAVRYPGGTFHFGQGCAEYWLSWSNFPVGERTP